MVDIWYVHSMTCKLVTQAVDTVPFAGMRNWARYNNDVGTATDIEGEEY